MEKFSPHRLLLVTRANESARVRNVLGELGVFLVASEVALQHLVEPPVESTAIHLLIGAGVLTSALTKEAERRAYNRAADICMVDFKKPPADEEPTEELDQAA